MVFEGFVLCAASEVLAQGFLHCLYSLGLLEQLNILFGGVMQCLLLLIQVIVELFEHGLIGIANDIPHNLPKFNNPLQNLLFLILLDH